MGGLRKYMPITYWTALIGALALCGIPPFAGFFSKDSLIEAVHLSTTPGAGIAHAAVLLGVFVTALYTFRMLFLTFHGEERFRTRTVHRRRRSGHDEPHTTAAHAHGGPPHESPWVVTLPLILLAIPSVYAGWAYIEPLLFGGFFGKLDPWWPHAHNVLAKMAEEFHGVPAFVLHGADDADVLAGGGRHRGGLVLLSQCGRIFRPRSRRASEPSTAAGQQVLLRRDLSVVFVGRRSQLGTLLWKYGDVAVIDGFFVNGWRVWWPGAPAIIRRFQSGFDLPLRIHDDHRRLRLADFVVRARLMRQHGNDRWLARASSAQRCHLGADRRRRGGARHSDRSATPTARAGSRWSAAVLGFLVTLPLVCAVRLRPRTACSSRSSCPGSRAFTSTTTSASTACRLLLILLNSFTTVLVVIAGWRVIEHARVAVHGGVPDSCPA